MFSRFMWTGQHGELSIRVATQFAANEAVLGSCTQLQKQDARLVHVTALSGTVFSAGGYILSVLFR